MTPPVVEPQIVPAVPYVAASPDWTGGYLGLALGYGDVGGNVGSGSGAIGGVFGGYDYDFGNFVLGGSLAYDRASIDIGGGNKLNSIGRIGVRGGYDTGPGLIYATAGAARAKSDTLGSDNGYFIGIGYDHRVTDRFTVGGEILYHDFKDFTAAGTNMDVTALYLRGAYRF